MTSPTSSGNREELLALAKGDDDARGLRALARQNATVKQLRALLRSAADDLEELEEAAQLKAWLEESAGQPIVIPQRKEKGTKPATTTVIAASDWHTAQIVDRAAVGGLNEHNPEIGQERAEKFARGVVKRVEHMQAAYQINELVLWLGGDFMVGELHGVDSARACDMPPLEEVGFCQSVLSGVITHILGGLDVPEIRVVCNWGNHGRSTEKPRSNRKHAYNHEYFMYGALAREFASESRLSWDISPAPTKVTTIAGFRMVTHHGDRLMGSAAGSGVGRLAPPFLNLANKQLRKHKADFLLIGHYHQYNVWNVGGINGSLVGIDEYAENMEHERPAQIGFNVDHERRAIGTVFPIWVD